MPARRSVSRRWGNILTLLRNQNQRGLSGVNVTSTVQAIDNLTYTYASGQGNQLTKVEDAGLATAGFNNAVDNPTEYNYNSNGSSTYDTKYYKFYGRLEQ